MESRQVEREVCDRESVPNGPSKFHLKGGRGKALNGLLTQSWTSAALQINQLLLTLVVALLLVA